MYPATEIGLKILSNGHSRLEKHFDAEMAPNIAGYFYCDVLSSTSNNQSCLPSKQN